MKKSYSISSKNDLDKLITINLINKYEKENLVFYKCENVSVFC